MYISPGKSHLTGTIIKYIWIGFLQPVPCIGKNNEVYMGKLDVIYMPDDSELFILLSLICNTRIIGIQGKSNEF